MLRNQKGFTLIEIIAVLVILGILAAVAIPKYMNMQDEARNKATQGALGAAAGEVSLRYAQLLLATNGGSVNMTQLDTELDANSILLGDYHYTYSTITNGIQVSVTAVDGGALGSPVTKNVVVQ